MPTWPGTLPQVTKREGYSRREKYEPLVTEVDDGREISRKRVDIDARLETLVYEMTGAQHAIWEAFWYSDLEKGTVSFTMPTPDAAGTYTNRTVKMGKDPYTAEPIGGGYWRVSIPVTVYY